MNSAPRKKIRPSKAITIKLNDAQFASAVTALEHLEKSYVEGSKKYPSLKKSNDKYLRVVRSTKKAIYDQAQMEWNKRNGYPRNFGIAKKKK